MHSEKQNLIRKDDKLMDDKKLPIIDKTEFTDDEFPDEMNNKKSEANKDGDTNE